TGAPAPRRLSRTASRVGNGAKEPENQGFLRSPHHCSTNCGGHQGIDAEADIAFASLGWNRTKRYGGGYVCFWHKADIDFDAEHVRSRGQSGYGADLSACPLMTHSGTCDQFQWTAVPT